MTFASVRGFMGIAAASAILACAPAEDRGWLPIHALGDHPMEWDSDHVQRDGQIVSVWARQPTPGQIRGEPTLELTHWAFDCPAGTKRLLGMAASDRAGNVLWEMTHPESERAHWTSPVVPQSFAEALMREVCPQQ